MDWTKISKNEAYTTFQNCRLDIMAIDNGLKGFMVIESVEGEIAQAFNIQDISSIEEAIGKVEEMVVFMLNQCNVRRK